MQTLVLSVSSLLIVGRLFVVSSSYKIYMSPVPHGSWTSWDINLKQLLLMIQIL